VFSLLLLLQEKLAQHKKKTKYKTKKQQQWINKNNNNLKLTYVRNQKKLTTETIPIYFPELEPKVSHNSKRKYPTTLANKTIVGPLFKTNIGLYNPQKPLWAKY